MKKLVFSLAIIAMFISSCNNDEIDDLSNRIDKLEQKIPTIDEQIASISQSIISLENVDKEMARLILTLEEKGNATDDELEILRQKNEGLGQKIKEVEDYVNRSSNDIKNWVSATFVTLEQYNAIVAEIASIKNSIAKYDSKITQFVSSAILEVENSVKTWVGEQLSNYYTIAEIDAKIADLERGQADNADRIEDVTIEINELKSLLQKLSNELTDAYRKAIEEAITLNNGIIDNKIANEIATVNRRIDNEISAINNRLNDIERRLDALEDKVDDLYERKLAIEFSNIENIGIVAGGTCRVNYIITQSAPPVHIATIAQNGWRAYVTKTSETEGYITVYAPNPLTTEPVIVLVSDEKTTIMRNLSFVEGVTTIATKAYAITNEATTLNIDVQTNLDYTVNIPSKANSWISLKDITTRATMRNDVIKLDIDENASKSSRSATLQLVCNDIEVGTISIYQQGVEIANNELVYTSSDRNIVTPYQETGFSANIISNTYSNGRGLIVFDKDITSIGEYAFYECSKLTSIKMPESVTKIREYAFYNSGLNNMILSNNITSIADYAFCSCNDLTTVTIPDNVTKIGKYAFSNCGKIQTVTIPSLVTSIGEGAFYNIHLRTVYCKPTTPPNLSVSTWGNYLFSSYTDMIIYVPKSSYNAYCTTKWWDYHISSYRAYDF